MCYCLHSNPSVNYVIEETDDLSPFLMANFTGEPGLAGFTGAKDNGGGSDNRSYKTCKAPVK